MSQISYESKCQKGKEQLLFNYKRYEVYLLKHLPPENTKISSIAANRFVESYSSTQSQVIFDVILGGLKSKLSEKPGPSVVPWGKSTCKRKSYILL